MTIEIYAPKLKDRWCAHYRVDKYWADEYETLTKLGLMPAPYEVCEDEGNTIATVGATDLFNGAFATLSVPYNTTNAQLAVGNSNTANSGDPVAYTDLLAAAGTKLNASDPASATNATPIVITATFSPTPVTGQTVVCSGFTGAGATAINDTWEITSASSSALTLLNSAGAGAITVTGATVQPINYYRQFLNTAPTISTNTCVLVAVFASANANFAWQEWGITTGYAATSVPVSGAANKQHQPPPHLFDRVVQSFGTKSSGNVWTLTVTLTLT